MEEPIHHHQKDDDGKEAGGRLEIECRDALIELVDDPHRDEPGDEGGNEADAGAAEHRELVPAEGADHVRGQRGQDQDAFQPLAENQDGDIEDGDGGRGARLGGIGRAAGRDPLPDQDRRHQQGGQDEDRLERNAQAERGDRSGGGE